MNTYWVPREDNEQADMLSKSSLETWDFGIRPDIALTLFEQFFRPRLDIFASRTFHVCKHYYTCCPDTRAIRADTFSVANRPDYSFAFPLPPLISKTLAKIHLHGQDRAKTSQTGNTGGHDDTRQRDQRQVHSHNNHHHHYYHPYTTEDEIIINIVKRSG